MYSFVSRENHMYGIIHNALVLLYLLYIADHNILPSNNKAIVVFASASCRFYDCSPALIDNNKKGRCSL